MANTSRKGYWPIGTMSGAEWSGKVAKYRVIGSNVFPGDLVTQGTDGCANVITAATEANILGVVVGVLPVNPPDPSDTLALSGNTQPALTQKYGSASATGVYALVCVAPDVILEGESIYALSNANIGQTINTTVTAGSTTTGCSTQVANDIGTAATGVFKIKKIVPLPDNDTSATNTKVELVFNRHIFAMNTAGV